MHFNPLISNINLHPYNVDNEENYEVGGVASLNLV